MSGYGGRVALSERSLGWLRDLHATLSERVDLDSSDLVDVAQRLGTMVGDVPAWIEPFSALLDQLVSRHPDAAEDVRRCFVEAAPVDPCPQVVGVEFPTMALRRAEWVRGNLHLSLAPLRDAPNVYTFFRIVGAEPRNWDVHGADDAAFELTMSGVNARVPMRSADIELIRGSY